MVFSDLGFDRFRSSGEGARGGALMKWFLFSFSFLAERILMRRRKLLCDVVGTRKRDTLRKIAKGTRHTPVMLLVLVSLALILRR
jgi:hypothetical protein